MRCKARCGRLLGEFFYSAAIQEGTGMAQPTVQTVIDALIAPVGRLEQTVDTLKCGDPSMPVTGIVTTFMPTQHVLEEALERKANLVIAHEGLFFAHHDEAGEARGGEVYRAKKQFLEESGIAVFRFHDYPHRYKPDAITEGLIRELEWGAYVRKHEPAASLLELPRATLRDIVRYVKEKLDIPHVRYMGDPDMLLTRVGVLVGYRGGAATAVTLFEQEQVELMIYGEGPEWETPEYVRDAIQQGRRRALIVLGHAESEEPGMKALARNLAWQYPGLPVHHIRQQQGLFHFD
jgi:putative NIF3 family GTP cyclohydrolase 1 type 2